MTVGEGSLGLFLVACFFILKHYFGKLADEQAEINNRIANLPKELKIHEKLKGIEHRLAEQLEGRKVLLSFSESYATKKLEAYQDYYKAVAKVIDRYVILSSGIAAINRMKESGVEHEELGRVMKDSINNMDELLKSSREAIAKHPQYLPFIDELFAREANETLITVNNMAGKLMPFLSKIEKSGPSEDYSKELHEIDKQVKVSFSKIVNAFRESAGVEKLSDGMIINLSSYFDLFNKNSEI